MVQTAFFILISVTVGFAVGHFYGRRYGDILDTKTRLQSQLYELLVAKGEVVLTVSERDRKATGISQIRAPLPPTRPPVVEESAKVYKIPNPSDARQRRQSEQYHSLRESLPNPQFSAGQSIIKPL